MHLSLLFHSSLVTHHFTVLYFGKNLHMVAMVVFLLGLFAALEGSSCIGASFGSLCLRLSAHCVCFQRNPKATRLHPHQIVAFCTGQILWLPHDIQHARLNGNLIFNLGSDTAVGKAQHTTCTRESSMCRWSGTV